MREAIEELFRMYKVEPNEDLIMALVLLIKHERMNGEEDMARRFMNKVDDVTGKR